MAHAVVDERKPLLYSPRPHATAQLGRERSAVPASAVGGRERPASPASAVTGRGRTRHSPLRPSMGARPSSKVYTSLPLPPPATPDPGPMLQEEPFFSRVAAFFSPVQRPERDANGLPLPVTHPVTADGRPGVPKVSRECIRAEIMCYGWRIVPVLLVFGLGAILLALWLSHFSRLDRPT